MSEVGRGARRLVQIFWGPFVVQDGVRVVVPEGSWRLVVLVALAGSPVDRRRAGGQLWPSGGDARAAGNLRSALWRLNKADIAVVSSNGPLMSLCPDVEVDVHLACDWAQRLIRGTYSADDLGEVPWPPAALDMLPGWYDDWVVYERERVRQRLLNGLDALAARLSAEHRYPDAVDAAMTAISADPLRESAHRVLVEAHLAVGNLAEARRAYLVCRDTFHRELGVEPSRPLTQLVALLPRARPPSSLGVR